MTNKKIMLTFILGCVITIIGAMFKLMHWPWATMILVTGMLCEVVSGCMLLIKIVKDQNPNSFLNK